MSRIIAHVFDVRAGQKEMYGGSSDTDVTDWQVKPYGRTRSLAVITAIPVQNRPRTSRIDVGVGGALLVIGNTLRRCVGTPQWRVPASGKSPLRL